MEKENVLNFHYKQTQFSFIEKFSLSAIFKIIEVSNKPSISFLEEMLIESSWSNSFHKNLSC